MTASRVTSALAAAAALLALALAALWLSPVAPWRAWTPPPPQAPNLGDAQAALLAANPAAAAAYPSVLERPLLQPSRRPEAPANLPAANQAPTSIEQVKLLGLVNGPALTGVLLDEQGTRRFVRQGERVGDWMLEAIEERHAVFMRGGERKPIELPYTYLDPAAAPAPPLPAGAKAQPSAARPIAPPPPAAAPPVSPPPVPPAVAPNAPPPAAAAANPGSAPQASFGGRRRAPSTPSPQKDDSR
ncbi:MAG: hypothetical protein FWG56_04840 [Desulfovibrionaceae bacterium]|nr:hypothetical protein [Desulfovibrionaceae bacterium]